LEPAGRFRLYRDYEGKGGGETLAMFDFLRNAFAVGPEKDIVSAKQISREKREELIGNLAKAIAERGLSAPTILFLESVKPMNFLGSQVMVFLEPLVKSVFPFQSYSEFAALLENRDCIERLILELERLSVESSRSWKEEEKRR